MGAVYKALDTQLNREVAVKRVIIEEGAPDSEESARNLLQEATSLGALQHPHIVTVYDSGMDEDGPFLIMELIKGRTLDEMVERGTLTWDDIYEVALQTQEALIAAQDLNLVHRDLKPGNIMVCWLASGKFQVKIVDFGLAKFSAAPSLQTIDHGDAVFGSIFFMAPEQFERTPLDQRTDMYAMGCIYYYALTAEYPFNGESAAAVMASHLQHSVTHLREVRPDIPGWAADWIMWHMERKMDDRPASARAALEQLLVLKKQAAEYGDSAVSTSLVAASQPAATPSPAAPKFNFGADNTVATSVAAMEPTQAVGTVHQDSESTAPVSIVSPNTEAVNPHTQAQKTFNQYTAVVTQQVHATPAATVPLATPAPALQAAVNPAAQGQGQAQAQFQPQIQGQVAAAAPAQTAGAAQPIAPVSAPKRGLSKPAKISIILILSVTTIVAILLVIGSSGTRNEIKAYNAAIIRAEALEKDEKLDEGLTVTRPELDALLNQSTSIEENQQRFLLRKSLAYAQGDSFDADAVIVDFVTNEPIDSSVRESLLNIVMVTRKNPSNIQPLLNYSEITDDTDLAVAAIHAAKANVDPENPDEYFTDFLDLLNNTDDTSLLTALEKVSSDIVAESDNKASFNSAILKSYKSSINKNTKHALLRLSGSVGTEEAGAIVVEAINSDDPTVTRAAISAMSKWPSDGLLDSLTEYIGTATNEPLRASAFDAAFKVIASKRERSAEQHKENIETLQGLTTSNKEDFKIILLTSRRTEPWAVAIIEGYIKGSNATLAKQAKQAKTSAARARAKAKNSK